MLRFIDTISVLGRPYQAGKPSEKMLASAFAQKVSLRNLLILFVREADRIKIAQRFIAGLSSTERAQSAKRTAENITMTCAAVRFTDSIC